jgi:nicotinamidase-related amidase
MTTLPGRGNTALLVIDVQNGVIEGAVDRDLAISGAQADQCIGATLHGAIVRGYDATLVQDAHTTVDLSAHGAPAPEQVIAHTNLYWKYQAAPDRVGSVVRAGDLDFKLLNGKGA